MTLDLKPRLHGLKILPLLVVGSPLPLVNSDKMRRTLLHLQPLRLHLLLRQPLQLLLQQSQMTLPAFGRTTRL